MKAIKFFIISIVFLSFSSILIINTGAPQSSPSMKDGFYIGAFSSLNLSVINDIAKNINRCYVLAVKH